MSRTAYLRIVPGAILLAISLATSVHGAGPVTTSMQVPLSGTVSVLLGDDSLDEVALSGMVHVVTQVTPPDPFHPQDAVRIRINLDQVSGVGQASGIFYVATGANRINLPDYPGDLNVSFDLHAVGLPTTPVAPPDPVSPLDISFKLTFSADTGVLSSVVILEMKVPVP